MLKSISDFFDNAVHSLAHKIQALAVLLWHMVTDALSTEIAQAPAMIQQAVIDASTASNKQQAFLDSLLKQLIANGVVDANAAVQPHLGELAAILGLKDGNALDMLRTLGVAKARAAGLIPPGE